MDFLIVGSSGFLGAIARYLIYLLESKYKIFNFPMGTLLINTFGCLMAGLLIGWASKTSPQHRQIIFLVSMGFIGSFTTFSTFSVETLQLIRANQLLPAFSNIALSVGFGLLAVWTGLKLA